MKRMIAGLLAIFGADCTSSQIGNPCDYPRPPASADADAEVVHVCVAGPAQRTGSARAPYASVTDALRARNGDLVMLVGEGTYAERIEVEERSIEVVGLGVDSVHWTPGGSVVALVRNGSLGVRGVTAREISESGIYVGEGGNLTVEEVEVVGAAGSEAFGIVVAGGHVVLRHARLADLGAAGLVLESVGAGRIEESAFEGNRVGVLVQRDGGSTEPDCDNGPVIRDSTFTDNSEHGVRVMSARTCLVENSISGGYHGVVVGKLKDETGAEVRVEGGQITGVDGAGLLVDDARAEVVDVTVAEAARAGLWVQGSAGTLVLEQVTSERNHVVGVGATAGASLEAQGTQVSGTRVGSGETGEIADGFLFFGGAQISGSGNSSEDNARAGFLVDDAYGRLESTTANRNDRGIVLQNVEPEAFAFDGVSLDGNTFGDEIQRLEGAMRLPVDAVRIEPTR